MHSLWSEKSKYWTLDEYNFQCVIPMMVPVSFVLASYSVYFSFFSQLAVGRHQSLGTADISLSPGGDKLPYIDVINLMRCSRKKQL